MPRAHCSESQDTAGRPYEQRVPHPEPLTPSRAAAADTLFAMSAPSESPAHAQAQRRPPMGSPSKRRQKHASTTGLHAPAGAGNGPGKRAAVSQAQGPAAKKASSVPEVGKPSSRAATAAATAETGQGPSAVGLPKSAAKRSAGVLIMHAKALPVPVRASLVAIEAQQLASRTIRCIALANVRASALSLHGGRCQKSLSH